MSKIKIEICCSSAQDAITAYKGGADRIELNSALCLGGLTPTPGQIKECTNKIDIPVMTMLRPRQGCFCYSDYEIETMKHDVVSSIESGSSGIVFGILDNQGNVEVEKCKQIINTVENQKQKTGKNIQLVFHRAIDVCADWKQALADIIDLKFDRVLTSGMKNKAIDGIENISQMIDFVDGKIEVLPGSGVKDFNVKDIISKTGADQVHSSCSKEYNCDNKQTENENILFNSYGIPEKSLCFVDKQAVIELRKAVDSL